MVKAKRGRPAAKGKKGKAKRASPQRRAPAARKPSKAQRAVPTALATDADNDVIPGREIAGIMEGPVRCETCNTDFASRKDFERHAVADHPDIPARISE